MPTRIISYKNGARVEGCQTRGHDVRLLEVRLNGLNFQCRVAGGLGDDERSKGDGENNEIEHSGEFEGTNVVV